LGTGAHSALVERTIQPETKEAISQMKRMNEIRGLQAETWASGESYQRYVGRWSRLVAEEYIRWLSIPPRQRWLDTGCGTGALTRAILQLASPVSVLGIDPSPSHISFAGDTIRDERATFLVANAESVPQSGNTFDVAASGLVLNFLADPALGLAEMHRLIRHDGTISAYVWDYAGRMDLMRYFWDAAVALDENAVALDEGNRFPICKPEPLRDLFTTGGLHNVDVVPLDVPTPFENFDDYWLPFLGGQGPAPGYVMSLTETRRTLLRDHLRASLPIADDGSIDLVARAWAIRGTKI
jgi:SAM-dependent methyltransferase